MVTIFGKDSCPYTQAAREDYKSRGVQFEYINVKKNAAELERMLTFSKGRRAVPVIVDGSRSRLDLAAREASETAAGGGRPRTIGRVLIRAAEHHVSVTLRYSFHVFDPILLPAGNPGPMTGPGTTPISSPATTDPPYSWTRASACPRTSPICPQRSTLVGRD